MNPKRYALSLAACFVLFASCDKGKPPAPQSAVAENPPVIAQPNQGVEVPLVFKGDSYSADPKAAVAGAKDGVLTVTATKLNDSHLLSQPVELSRSNTYLIKGLAKGTDLISSKPPHAAGIGLMAQRMVVDLPAGTYDWKPFEATFTVAKDGPVRFTVGIGGWKSGQGKLEVKNLKLYR